MYRTAYSDEVRAFAIFAIAVLAAIGLGVGAASADPTVYSIGADRFTAALPGPVTSVTGTYRISPTGPIFVDHGLASSPEANPRFVIFIETHIGSAIAWPPHSPSALLLQSGAEAIKADLPAKLPPIVSLPSVDGYARAERIVEVRTPGLPAAWVGVEELYGHHQIWSASIGANSRLRVASFLFSVTPRAAN